MMSLSLTRPTNAGSCCIVNNDAYNDVHPDIAFEIMACINRVYITARPQVCRIKGSNKECDLLFVPYNGAYVVTYDNNNCVITSIADAIGELASYLYDAIMSDLFAWETYSSTGVKQVLGYNLSELKKIVDAMNRVGA